jgi:hypothetical protein
LKGCGRRSSFGLRGSLLRRDPFCFSVGCDVPVVGTGAPTRPLALLTAGRQPLIPTGKQGFAASLQESGALSGTPARLFDRSDLIVCWRRASSDHIAADAGADDEDERGADKQVVPVSKQQSSLGSALNAELGGLRLSFRCSAAA